MQFFRVVDTVEHDYRIGGFRTTESEIISMFLLIQ